MNSQIVSISHALKSKTTFTLLAIFVPVSLCLKAGFVSVSVLWFFVLCVNNKNPSLRSHFKTHYVLFFPILLFLLHIVWVFIFNDSLAALNLIAKKFHLFLIPAGFIILNKKITDDNLHVILVTFLLCCLACSLVCYSNAIYNIIRHKSFVDEAVGEQAYFYTYLQLTEPVDIPPLYLSMFCNLAFLTALQTPFIKNESFRFSIAAYIALFIIMISATVGMVSLVIITGLWLWTSGHRKILIYISSGILVLALSIALSKHSMLRKQYRRLLKPNYDEQYGNMVQHTSSRMAIWYSVWETIKQRPLIGFGSVDGQKALEETYKKNGFVWGITEDLNPHNEYLTAILDLGIIGSFVLTATIALPLISSIRSKDLLTGCFILIIILFFSVESVLARQKGMVFFAFFYSLFYCHLVAKKGSRSSSDS